MSEPSAGDARLGPGAPKIAATAVATWQAIDDALRPILGARGVHALYWRSLHLAAAEHPWLASRTELAEDVMDLEALAAALSAQPVESAKAGSRAVQEKFLQLLVSLVGAPLASRLLTSVPSMFADTPNSQDTPR